MASLPIVRSPGTVTLAVWNALFLREAVGRISATRAAWVWLVLEPVFHIAFVIFLFSTIRLRVIGGIDTSVWIMVGLLAFFMFRRPAQRAMNAVSASQPLYTFRQVKPVDVVLVRATLEGFLMSVIASVLLVGAALYGLPVIPSDMLMVLGAALGLWLCGLGFGLVTSVAAELVPEIGRLINLTAQPLYFFSGILFPLDKLPSPYREWLLLNPLAHGVEAARLGFAPLYHAFPETSLAYLYCWAIGIVFFGLALHNRYASRLAAL